MANENSVGAVSTNTFQYNPNACGTGSLGMYDYDDYDLDYGLSYGYPMGGSIFGNGYMSSLTDNNQNYFDNMREYQKFNVEYNIEQEKLARNADMKINASMEAIKNSARVLKDKIVANEQDQIMEAYEKYVNTVAQAYGEGTPEEIKARATTLYAQMNGNQSIIDDLRQYAHSSTTQGFIQSMTLGGFDRKSAEDNISEITGAPVNTGEKTKQNVGRVAGAATFGTLAYTLSKCLHSGKAKVIGWAAAGISALMSFITGKVTT